MSSKNKVLVLDKKICYFAKQYEACEYRSLPLFKDGKFIIIDLNQNGLEIDTNNPAIIRGFFDRNSYKLNGWVEKEEGIVVLKKDEVEGLIKSFDWFEDNYFRSYENLDLFKAFDYNKDKIIDIEDPGFNSLYIWRDTNQDMICQDDEVKSFIEIGINSIELKMQPSCANNNQECSNNNYVDHYKLVCNGDAGILDLFSVSLLENIT